MSIPADPLTVRRASGSSEILRHDHLISHFAYGLKTKAKETLKKKFHAAIKYKEQSPEKNKTHCSVFLYLV